MELSPSDKKALRGKAQLLDPAFTIGKAGLSPAVLKAIDVCLAVNQLIKIRFTADKEETSDQIDTISGTLKAEIVGTVGKTASFYKKAKKKVIR